MGPKLLMFVVMAALLMPAHPVSVQTTEQELVNRYAPIIALKQHDAPCDFQGEPRYPVSVDVVLDKCLVYQDRSLSPHLLPTARLLLDAVIGAGRTRLARA